VLFLVSAHGGLSQAAQAALTDLGHDVTVAVVASPESMVSAVRDHRPDLIVCPMLTKMIPEEIWSQHLCLVLHPGPVGDRGPSAIDWAIELSCPEWGVTVLEANGEFDAGTIWATRTFARQSVTKSSLYRHEVRHAAVDALVDAVTKVASGAGAPAAATAWITVQDRPLMRQDVRAIDWRTDPTDVVLRKIRAGDGHPGVLDAICGTQFHLFGAHPEARLRGNPGEIVAQRHGAVCRATVDGAVWISHLKQHNTPERTYIKLPAVTALVRAGLSVDAPEVPLRIDVPTADTFREIVYRESDGVGYLYFDFYNGAMSTEQCQRLREAYRYARSRRSTRVIVLMGGRDFFSTGIHLNVIEDAADPALESWRNLHAINDVVHDVVTTGTHYLVSALRGDVAAGGVAFGLAADRVVARDGIVLNPYYQHMGGLYGSEYWTYLLPRRLGSPMAAEVTAEPFTPISAHRAMQIGLLDATFGPTVEEFHDRVVAEAEHIAAADGLANWIEFKRRRRARDEQRKPLEHYRREELARSHECFFGPNRRYHEARSRFTHKRPLVSFAERFVMQT
jgi:putative two-component system protein, hydrogenase maturation factor HypX/HoxX